MEMCSPLQAQFRVNQTNFHMNFAKGFAQGRGWKQGHAEPRKRSIVSLPQEMHSELLYA